MMNISGTHQLFYLKVSFLNFTRYSSFDDHPSIRFNATFNKKYFEWWNVRIGFWYTIIVQNHNDS